MAQLCEALAATNYSCCPNRQTCKNMASALRTHTTSHTHRLEYQAKGNNMSRIELYENKWLRENCSESQLKQDHLPILYSGIKREVLEREKRSTLPVTWRGYVNKQCLFGRPVLPVSRWVRSRLLGHCKCRQHLANHLLVEHRQQYLLDLNRKKIQKFLIPRMIFENQPS